MLLFFVLIALAVALFLIERFLKIGFLMPKAIAFLVTAIASLFTGNFAVLIVVFVLSSLLAVFILFSKGVRSRKLKKL